MVIFAVKLGYFLLEIWLKVPLNSLGRKIYKLLKVERNLDLKFPSFSFVKDHQPQPPSFWKSKWGEVKVVACTQSDNIGCSLRSLICTCSNLYPCIKFVPVRILKQTFILSLIAFWKSQAFPWSLTGIEEWRSSSIDH